MKQTNTKILWKNFNGKIKLYTIYPTSSKKNQERNWSPFLSKLSAALFNGLEVFPFRNNSKIFFLEESRTTTLTHIHDLVDSSSQIISHKLNEKNLEINYADKNGIESFDVMYFDSGTIKNPIAKIVDYQKLLKKFGFLIIVLNSLENEIISSKELSNWFFLLRVLSGSLIPNKVFLLFNNRSNSTFLQLESASLTFVLFLSLKSSDGH